MAQVRHTLAVKPLSTKMICPLIQSEALEAVGRASSDMIEATLMILPRRRAIMPAGRCEIADDVHGAAAGGANLGLAATQLSTLRPSSTTLAPAPASARDCLTNCCKERRGWPGQAGQARL